MMVQKAVELLATGKRPDWRSQLILIPHGVHWPFLRADFGGCTRVESIGIDANFALLRGTEWRILGSSFAEPTTGKLRGGVLPRPHPVYSLCLVVAQPGEEVFLRDCHRG